MEVKKEAIERGYKVWRWDPSCEELLDSTKWTQTANYGRSLGA